jgi:hypothetical protein
LTLRVKLSMLLPNVSLLLMLLLISEAEAVLFASQISSSLGIYSLVLEGDAIYIYIYILPFSSRFFSNNRILLPLFMISLIACFLCIAGRLVKSQGKQITVHVV